MKIYEPVIGLEIHAELKTRTKMFCDSLNDPDEKEPNKNVCPVCMGHPGTLPTINKKAVEGVLKVGSALHCKIAEHSHFDRKNYFYPDLPKGYQISQYAEPLCGNGFLVVSSGHARVRIRRIHLEEDTGKLIHPRGKDHTLVDYNRAGVPLMELVTEPDIRSASDARKFCEELQLIFRYLGVSEANMEKGQMRCEVNLSLRPKETEKFGTKVEIKNLNSFKSVERAIAYEIGRQSELLERGEKVAQETRGWDDTKEKTFSQRSKEEAHDYRYFPEPDLPPLSLRRSASDAGEEQRRAPSSFSSSGQGSQDKERRSRHTGQDKVVLDDDAEKKGWVAATNEIDVDKLARSLPELPQARRERFSKLYGLSDDQIEVFTFDKPLGDYFEGVASELKSEHKSGEYSGVEPSKAAKDPTKHFLDIARLAANNLINDMPRALQESGKSFAFFSKTVTAENFAEFIIRIEKGVISSHGAKIVLARMIETGADPDEIIKDQNLAQVSDAGEIENIVRAVIEKNPGVVEDFKSGKQNALQFLVGQVMKETKGRANPKVVQETLRKILNPKS